MGQIEIIGAPGSTYVRVVRMICAEKGIDSLVPVGPHTPQVDAIHPFGRIPVMRHDGFELCESKAIATYLDLAFPGPRLIPADARGAALVEQWVSLVNTTFDKTLVREYLLAYVFPGTPDGKPDRARVDAAVPAMKAQLAILEKRLGESPYLAGDAFTLADINLLPIIAYLHRPPESAAELRASPHLSDWFARCSARPSFAATAPPQG